MRTAVIYNFLIEATIIAGIAILLLIPVRKYLRKALGNRAICFAWLLVAIRLLCPLSLPNPLINEIWTPYNDQPKVIRPIAAQLKIRTRDALRDLSYRTIRRHIDEEGLTYNEAFEKPDYQLLSSMTNDIDFNGRLAKGLMIVYGAGMLGVAGWFVIANARFRKKLNRNRIASLEGELLEYYNGLCEQRKVKPLLVFLVDPLSSACLVGVIRPFIALPLAANIDQAKHMLAHEVSHYKAKDHLWTLLTLVCCAVHWFNPLVWAAAAMSRMDRELRCDDSVTRNMDEDARKQYAGTLIQSVTRRTIPGLPVLCTGMSMTGRKLKIRVGGILSGDRRIQAFAIAFTVLTCLLLVAAFGTGTYGEQPDRYAILYPGYDEPVYDPQPWEEALAVENAIKTDEDAIQAAKDILTGPYVKLDLDSPDVRWVVERQFGWYGKATYMLFGYQGDDLSVIMSIAADGSGVHHVHYEQDPFYKNVLMNKFVTINSAIEGHGNLSDVLTEEEQQEIINFCCAFTEQMEPGRSNTFQDIFFNGYTQADDALYVLVEAPCTETTGVNFILQVKPEIRVVEYATGNG